jgi:DNA-binding PadR family transcriptional regulator
MNKQKYNGYEVDYLHQYIIYSMLKMGGSIYDIDDFVYEFDRYDYISESKIRRRLNRLEKTNLVFVESVAFDDSRYDKKLYELTREGEEWIKNMGDDLSKPMHLKLDQRVKELEERVEYLVEQTDVQQEHIEAIEKVIY